MATTHKRSRRVRGAYSSITVGNNVDQRNGYDDLSPLDRWLHKAAHCTDCPLVDDMTRLRRMRSAYRSRR